MLTLTPVDLSLIGADTPVPLVTGGTAPVTNLDYAASAPCLSVVKRAVDELLPWYSSVHRGAGWKSQVTTRAYEAARRSVSAFVNAPSDDCVLFVRNTTDAINLLASVVPGLVVCFAAEHHANLLPWDRGRVVVLPIPGSPAEALASLERVLRREQVALIAVTGASNVTGEIWPYQQIAALGHCYGARTLLDAAQLAPHHRIDMVADGIDYVALSGHKLYAPYGCGALIGPCDWLATGRPYLAGGGAVEFVRIGDVQWAALPDRHEAGSPNVLGAVALGVACDTLAAAPMDRLAEIEAGLLTLARDGLARVPGLRTYTMWPDAPRIGVVAFTLDSLGYAELAAVLSAEYGIATRHGCFCAHPLVTRLLGLSEGEAVRIADTRRAGLPVAVPGMVRASFGVGTGVDDVLTLLTALDVITSRGTGWHYATSLDGTQCEPVPDPRVWPVLPFPLS